MSTTFETADIAKLNIAIIGCGNIGTALARGLVRAGQFKPAQITVTRRTITSLDHLKTDGYTVSSDNHATISTADVVFLTVQPQQLADVMHSANEIDWSDKTIISIVSGATISAIAVYVNGTPGIVRAMPNTAIGIGESITCLAFREGDRLAFDLAQHILTDTGITLEISEELMTPATALGACGVAYFLRFIRAASQGGIEAGFHPDQALKIAAQSARGAASLVLENNSHPEWAIDEVTTPRGATITGLNTMEHEGLSSAIIKGIVASADKIDRLLAKAGSH